MNDDATLTPEQPSPPQAPTPTTQPPVKSSNKKLLIIGIVLVVLTVSGGAGYFVWKNTDTKSSKSDTPKSAVLPPAEVKTIPAAHNAFGFDVLKALSQDEGNNNVFISPSSIALALSMVYNGAGGETKAAMQKTLQYQSLDIDTVNKESLSLVGGLKNPDPKVELSIANSVWVNAGTNPRQSFLDVVKNSYNAEASTLDFKSPKSSNTINDWVSKNTKGKITGIVPSPLPPDAVMYLVNAVYFKGSWTTEFDKAQTTTKDFTSFSGTKQKHPFMSRGGEMSYYETDDFQSVSLPYGDNKRLSMYVFLPKKDLQNFTQRLDVTTWDSWMDKYEDTEGTLLLPKFKIEYEKSLVGTLAELGMGTAFGDGADLSGIGPNLFISEVKHKTYLDVNEEGTEAAAVTSVGVDKTSAGGSDKKTFTMDVNHPFFVAIRDSQTKELLFIGTIQNP